MTNFEKWVVKKNIDLATLNPKDIPLYALKNSLLTGKKYAMERGTNTLLLNFLESKKGFSKMTKRQIEVCLDGVKYNEGLYGAFCGAFRDWVDYNDPIDPEIIDFLSKKPHLFLDENPYEIAKKILHHDFYDKLALSSFWNYSIPYTDLGFDYFFARINEEGDLFHLTKENAYYLWNNANEVQKNILLKCPILANHIANEVEVSYESIELLGNIYANTQEGQGFLKWVCDWESYTYRRSVVSPSNYLLCWLIKNGFENIIFLEEYHGLIESIDNGLPYKPDNIDLVQTRSKALKAIKAIISKDTIGNLPQEIVKLYR